MKTGWPFRLLDELLDAAVVGNRELQPAVGGDAVLDAVAAAQGDGLFDRQAALEMDVKIDQREAGLLEPRDLGVRRVGSTGLAISAGIARADASRMLASVSSRQVGK